MVRDGVFNMGDRLRERGLDPRRIGDDAWEARCPAHRGADHSLAITRNEFNHVVLTCRSTENCQHIRIVRALGWTNDHVYAETPDWLISRLRHVPIQPPSLSDLTPLPEDLSDSSADAAPESWPTVELGLQTRAGDDDAMLTAGFDPGETAVAPASDSDGASTTSTDSLTGESTPYEQVPGNSIKVHVSSISVTMERGNALERQSAVQVLARLASSARLFRSADGRLCAQVPVGDRFEIFGLKSAAFRDWLIDGFLIDQPEPPSSWAIRRVVGMLEARARFNDAIPEVFVRVGRDGVGQNAPYFLDLGDPSGRAIEIHPQGWFVVDRPDVHFRRPAGQLPLPVPSPDGSIDLLRPYVNLSDDDFRLLITWMTASLRPVGPYPILVLSGPQASAKTTLATMIRLLIDPQVCPVLYPPDSTQNLMATAVNGWLLAYDNISTIRRWMSDTLCQLVFGAGFAGRALFTNDERTVIFAQRPVFLSGIDDFVQWPDLRDRCVFLHLSPIPPTRRRAQDELWSAFHADYPRMLGGLLDAIVGGLRELPSVHLNELPRMADYAKWGEAVGRGLGWESGSFLAIYNDNRREATEALLEDSMVASVMLALARKGINWSGTPLELYRKITENAGKATGPRWPKTVHAFGNELRRIAPQLRLHGLSIAFGRTRDARIVTLTSEGKATS